MHEVRAKGGRCAFSSVTIGMFATALLRNGLTNDLDFEGIISLAVALVLFPISIFMFLSSILRVSRLTWSNAELVFKTAYGTTWVFDSASFGPATPFNTYYRGLRSAYFLLLRPVDGSKGRQVNLSCFSLSERELEELADQINAARGFPEGARDAEAVYEVQIAAGSALLGLMLFAPIFATLYLAFFFQK